MASNIPNAKTKVDPTAGVQTGGLKTICVWTPAALNADGKPRLFGSSAAVAALHGYCPGVEYCARHADETGLNFLVCALPITAAGVVGRISKAGNTGTSVATISTSGAGVLHEHDGRIRVKTGGTVGTSQIVLEYSMDDGFSWKETKIGTGTTYTIPFFNVQLSLTVGTLIAGETIITWSGTGPRSDATGWLTARTKLAEQMKSFRNILLCGDLQNNTEAQAVLDQVNAYETANERFTYIRTSVRDRLPLATMSKDIAKMTAGTTVTFDTTLDTVTRATGSWLADGFVLGDTVVITGTASNNVTAVISTLTALVMTLSPTNLVNEGPTANATIVGYPTLTFAEAGANDTVTRSRGNWLNDGFRVGDKIKITGTVSNNVTAAFGLSAVTALVLTMGNVADDFAAETIGTHLASVTAGQTKAEWMADLDSAFTIDAAFRIDMSAGRARKLSPHSVWNLREPASWVASLREHAHDLHIPSWAKQDGPTGWDLNDLDGNLVEWDDRVDGKAASAARFTSLRTWSNGPAGAFVCLGLTREQASSPLSYTHNVAVTNLACTTVQLNTENVVGRVLVLDEDGHATSDSLKTLEMQVNAQLDKALLENKEGEGQRASLAVWQAATNDDLSVPEATLNGVLTLELLGTVFQVRTSVRVS